MPVKELEFLRFYPAEADENVWNEAINMSLVSFKENNPDDPAPPPELIRKQLSSLDENPFFIAELYLLKNAEEKLVGNLIMAFPRPDSPEYESQKHMGIMQVFVLPDCRKQGIGRAALEKTVNVFHERGLSLIQGDTTRESGHAFAKRFGGEIAIEGRINRLYMKDVDWDLIERWSDESANANPGVVIETFEGLPDESEVETYAKLLTEIANQQPFEELEGVEMSMTPEKLRKVHEQQQERGDIHITQITRESDGSISGLTEITYNPQRPHIIHQELTGVQEKYRGRSLGKWLKASMLLYIRETYPDAEFINTGNANSNAPMLSINERMGFKLYKHTAFYKLQVNETMKELGLL